MQQTSTVRISWVRKYRRITAYLALLALAPLTLAGCYGAFPLTKSIYHTNGNIGGAVGTDTTQRKLVRSFAFWLFSPIYFVAGIADAFVFNVIEFWSGNVVEIGQAELSDGRTVALAPSADGHEAVLTISRQGQVIGQERYVRLASGAVEVRDMQGQLVAHIDRDSRGGLQLKDLNGHTVRVISAAQLAAHQL